jgi:RNA polymerase sigma-70 factor (ECF subfamily)
MTDTELIRGILEHDRQAFQYLVDKFQKQVVKTAYYFTGNMEDAEDLSQEIFLEILDSASSFRHSAALSTWIYRITVNRSLNQIKRNKRREIFKRMQHLFTGSSDGHEDGMGVESHGMPYEQKENRMLLRNALVALPENQRIAFVLNKYEELSYKEISGIMNLSLSAVESLIHRAKLNLQKQLMAHYPEYQKK